VGGRRSGGAPDGTARLALNGAAPVRLAAAWLFGPLSLLATWVACAGALAAVGLGVRALVSPRSPLSGRALIACFWAGVAAVILFLQAWHLFLPADGAGGLLLLGLAAAGIVAQRGELRAWWSRWRPVPGPGVAALALFIGWWVAGQGLGEVAAFDTYMYHVPATDWLRQHAIVPGLANLQERFGFNNASFLLAAVLESGPWQQGAPHLLNGMFVVPALALGLAALRDVGARREITPSTACDIVLLAPALAIACDPPLFRGIGPDAPATLALFAGVSFLLRCREETHGDAERAFFAVTAVGAFAAGAAFKLSVAAAAVPFALVALWLLARGGDRRALAAAAFLAVTIGGLWLLRGVLLSGYPLYPSTALAAPVDWRVPEEQARASYAWVSFFARWFDDPETYNRGFAAEPCAPFAWLGPWLRSLTHPSSLWRMILPALLALGLAAVAAKRRVRPVPAWLLLPLLAAFAFWLAVAPRPLFGFWIPWLFAAVLAAMASPRLRGGEVAAALALALAAFTMALPLLGRGLDAARATSASNVRAALGVWRVPADPDSWIEPTRWAYPLTPYTTRSGLVLLVPAGNRCGRAPLNCTSHPAANLELRGGDLADGFRVAGGWQAERWPNPWSGFLEAWRARGACR
jgi:hypothetical protein